MSLVPEIAMPCPEEGCDGTLRRRAGKWGPWYACGEWRTTGCNGGIGCHPNGEALGVPAAGEVKKLRIEAHGHFDKLWKEGRMSRGAAYRWLAQRMGRSEVHMAEMNEEECREVIALTKVAAISGAA